MRSRRSKRPPFPQPSALQVLLEAAVPVLAAHGVQRCPSAPFLAAAGVLITTAQGCGWEAQTTAQELVERYLGQRPWTWRWEGADLVLELPGWTAPPMHLVAIQPGLFDYPVG